MNKVGYFVIAAGGTCNRTGPVPGKNIFMRKMQIEKSIGFDKTGAPAYHICVLTDAGGKIITAFPGSLQISEP